MESPTSDQQGSPFDAEPSPLLGLPPSAKLVAKTLDLESNLTQSQLTEKTLLPSRTVRYALSKLDDAGVLVKRYDATDARRKIYSLGQ